MGSSNMLEDVQRAQEKLEDLRRSQKLLSELEQVGDSVGRPKDGWGILDKMLEGA